MAKKKLKKLLKAALIGGAGLLAAKGLGKGLGKKRKSVQDTAAGEMLKTTPFKHDLESYKPKFKYKPYDPSDDTGVSYSAKGGRIGAKTGGRTSKKHGGRTGKQFGGGLGSTARRDMRSGYYPDDMGMRGGRMYEKGGRVKSMGVAKRGGGVAKR